MHTGVVFNIQKYSVEDGPGIRTTIFLKGCPLCCAWCHNPEGRQTAPEWILLKNRCLVCGQCREACPFGRDWPGQGALPVSHPDCILCRACLDACPTQARQLMGQPMTVQAVMDEIRRDLIFYEDSQGGVTFSGGEPLLQPAFLLALLQACRNQEIHTAVDTCGFAAPESLLQAAALTDLFLFDLKFMDEAKHRQHTGVSNLPILENLQSLGRVHGRIWVRIPILPGLNDDRGELAAMAEWIRSIPAVRQVNLLPYHKIGIQKFARLGQTYPLDQLEPPSPEKINEARAIFRERGLPTRVGG